MLMVKRVKLMVVRCIARVAVLWAIDQDKMLRITSTNCSIETAVLLTTDKVVVKWAILEYRMS